MERIGERVELIDVRHYPSTGSATAKPRQLRSTHSNK